MRKTITSGEVQDWLDVIAERLDALPLPVRGLVLRAFEAMLDVAECKN